jgi:peptide/nickel transport system substrate-binding protein
MLRHDESPVAETMLLPQAAAVFQGENMRRLIALLLLAAAPAMAQPRDTLTIGMVQFPPDMHPNITTTSIKDTILAAARRLMTGFTADGRVICQLCTEVPSLANGMARIVPRPDGTDGMEVTFTLKPDLFWADGVPVTAADFAFAYKVTTTFSAPQKVEKVEALDATHVRYFLNSTIYDFDRVADGPLPEHIEGPILAAAANALDYGQKSAFNRHPEEPGLWMGPYRITEFRPNDQVTLAPNPYWRGTKPYFQKITMRLIENTSALQANLLSGDVDTVATGNLGLTLDQIIALTKTQSARFDFDFIPLVASYEHLAVNHSNKLLADKRTRQAMQMAIDRKTIVAKLFDNRFEVADSFKHPTQFGWDPSVVTYKYDPKGARAKLAEVGFKPGSDGILVAPDGTRFSVDLVSTAGNRTRELIEQVIQTSFKAVGIDVVIKNEPARVLFGETLRKRSFTGLVEFQNDAPLDSVPNTYFHSSYIPTAENNWSGLNYAGWSNAAMDEAMTKARAELDPAKRKILWKTILDIAADEVPEINLFFPASGLITPKWMTGINNPERRGLITAWIEDWRAR